MASMCGTGDRSTTTERIAKPWDKDPTCKRNIVCRTLTAVASMCGTGDRSTTTKRIAGRSAPGAHSCACRQAPYFCVCLCSGSGGVVALLSTGLLCLATAPAAADAKAQTLAGQAGTSQERNPNGEQQILTESVWVHMFWVKQETETSKSRTSSTCGLSSYFRSRSLTYCTLAKYSGASSRTSSSPGSSSASGYWCTSLRSIQE